MRLIKKDFAEKLKNGEIAIIPTDTIYGVVGSAQKPKIVKKIYQLKSRNLKKPLIILISSIEDLKIFKIKLTIEEKNLISKLWPGKISIILSCPYKKFEYLHRGTKKLAFRLPKNKWLLEILKLSGPLVAPSANPEGLKPATTVAEAKNYFNKKIDLYVDQGKLNSKPSTLIEIKNGKIKILRQGDIKAQKNVLLYRYNN